MRYDIAGMTIDICGENEYLKEKISVFKIDLSDDTINIDQKIKIEAVKELDFPEGEVLFGTSGSWIKKTGAEKGYYICTQNINKDEIISVLDTDDNWEKVFIRYIKGRNIADNAFFDEGIPWYDYHPFQLVGVAFRNLVIKRNGIVIHSSSIEFEGGGLIFSAPSQTGKSTHTGLWKKLYGEKVTIVNDDRPAIRYINGLPMLCGTPWSGSSHIYAKKVIPLKAVIMMQQYPKNEIRRLSAVEALPLLMPRCFLPYNDRTMMDGALSTLERLLKDVPVFLLKCLPDFKAVELVRKCTNI